jgi:hypothetical protein
MSAIFHKNLLFRCSMPHKLAKAKSLLFFFRWFRFSLQKWAAATLTWAEGEHEYAWAEPEYPEHALS